MLMTSTLGRMQQAREHNAVDDPWVAAKRLAIGARVASRSSSCLVCEIGCKVADKLLVGAWYRLK